MDAFDCKNVSCDFAEIVRCCSPVMIWGQKAGAAGALEETLACLSWRRLLGWLLGKSSLAKSSDISSPGNCGVGDHFWKVNSAQTLSRQPEEKLSTEENTPRWRGNTGNKWKIHPMKTHEAYSPFTSWYHWHARSRLVGTCDLNTVWMQHRKDYPLLLVVSIKVKNLIFRRTTAVYRPLLEK